MKKLYLIIYLLLIVVLANSQSKTYFLSPDGDNANSGLSVSTPWRTLEKVNQFTFSPGDVILLKSGGIWHGQMHPKGSGEKGKPIVIGSYGDGNKPVINTGDAEGAAICLVNQSWWEIQNIEITSGARPELGIGRQGIVALYEGDNSETEHIIIEDCFIHDVWGQMGGNSKFCGYNSAAIFVGKVLGGGRPTRNGYYDDILITNNRIERVDKCGIIVFGGRNNVKVSHNYIENLGGDAIFVNGPMKGLIEYNVAKRTCMRSGDPDLEGGESFWPHTAAIWIQNTTETIIQYNEVYDTGRQPGNGDGNAYDFDFNCKNCILQYNYSRNNHGFLLIMYNTFGNITRYNISENDQTHLIQMQGNIEDKNIIHNNVFYVDYGTIDLDFFCGDANSKDKTKLGAYFRNNIFYATGQGRFRTVYTSGSALERQYNHSVKLPAPEPGTLFYHNCYSGTWINGIPYDPKKLVSDPMFIAPGTGNGLAALDGYKLKPGSPCINTGMLIAMNADRDFYGNPINDGSPDFGVYEQIGSGVFADKQKQDELDRKVKADLDLSWAKMTFPERIIIPEEGGEVHFTLTEPLPENVIGKLILKGSSLKAAPQIIQTGRNAGNDFVFKVKSVGTLYPSPVLSVELAIDELNESWEIPVFYSRKSELKRIDGISIDGNQNEWGNIPAFQMNNKAQVFAGQEMWHSPGDGSCVFKAAVSGANLIMMVEVVDGEIVTSGSLIDNLEVLLVNGDSEPGRRFRGGNMTIPVQKNDGALKDIKLNIGRRQILLQNAKTFYKRTGNGYVIELSVPFETIGFSPAPGKGSEIGIEVCLNNAVTYNGTVKEICLSGSGSPANSFSSIVFSRYLVKE